MEGRIRKTRLVVWSLLLELKTYKDEVFVIRANGSAAVVLDELRPLSQRCSRGLDEFSLHSK